MQIMQISAASHSVHVATNENKTRNKS